MEAADSSVKAAYMDYLAQYRSCLAETNVDHLERLWRELDIKWMGIRHWVQVSSLLSGRLSKAMHIVHSALLRCMPVRCIA